LRVNIKNVSQVLITYQQALEKFYHQGLGAGGNPGGGGNSGDGYGNNGPEDDCPVPKEDIEQSSQGQGKYGVETYQVKSQIGKHNKLKKISKKIRTRQF